MQGFGTGLAESNVGRVLLANQEVGAGLKPAPKFSAPHGYFLQRLSYETGQKVRGLLQDQAAGLG